MAEKTGILKLDILSGAYKKEGEVIYSLEERRIGKWIDNKPLYEITLKSEGSVRTGEIVIPFDMSNVKLAFITSGFVKDTANNFSAPAGFYYSNNYISATIGSDGVHIFVQGYAYEDFVVTIRYTKISD